jgi:hypothetical protein
MYFRPKSLSTRDRSNDKPRRTYKQRVLYVYPKAACIENEGIYEIYANNGTGNVIAASETDEQDAWRRAITAISSQRATV